MTWITLNVLFILFWSILSAISFVENGFGGRATLTAIFITQFYIGIAFIVLAIDKGTV